LSLTIHDNTNMSKPTENHSLSKPRSAKLIIKILLGIGVLGLVGFMCALIAMLTHYNLFKG